MVVGIGRPSAYLRPPAAGDPCNKVPNCLLVRATSVFDSRHASAARLTQYMMTTAAQPRHRRCRVPPRPRRWAAAVAALIILQDEYRAWLDNLPPNLEGSRLAEKLQAIAELDLDELQAIDPPRGYGRD